eukprot:CAMPEP_0198432488 /NCGR_PEP_ID=MMETSP1452-20131203/23049_1 /TAXON_ID=1181717 /ORGANISM="Synchroma pusillum, Strain CCMP3072" /LENGTH=55 /DNA_ID=CAMNT_0044152969 /DNA_START=53 /DNA_END=217 /DNA_ORIENTATION=-
MTPREEEQWGKCQYCRSKELSEESKDLSVRYEMRGIATEPSGGDAPGQQSDGLAG